ncbi:MAG: SpoIIE family protein phosphatase [Candidatus Firestonebacteria bacterium]|nr:SpoIIE family protein phosphatase [Candidatus Firestonebacteria bacterium]
MENTPKRETRKSSVKVEFALWVMLFLGATILVLTSFTLSQEREALTREVTRRGLALAQYVATHGQDPFLTNDKLMLATLVGDVMKNEDMVYALMVDRNGRVVASDKSDLIGSAYVRPPGDYPLDRPSGRTFTWRHPLAGLVIDVGIPLILQGTTKIGEVHLGVSRSTIDRVVNQAWRQVMLVAFIFLSGGLLGSFVLVTFVLRPVSELTKGAQAIGAGYLNYQIPAMRNNELGQLAVTFNRMTRELKIATERALEQERIKKELQLAHQIQQTLLPKQTPEAAGFSFGTLYRAAKEVGGDYYDFFWLDKTKLGMVVADVCGKGVPAAMLMSMARSMLKSIARNYTTPSEVLKELNRLLSGDLKNGMFITVLYAVLDVPKKTLTYALAGHNPGLLVNPRSHKAKSLSCEPPCLPVGLDRGAIFEKLIQDKKITLAPHDVVVLYTDGVTEAMNAEREEFGESGLQACLEGQGVEADAAALIQALDGQLTKFCGDIPQNDDIAAIILQVD